MNELQGKLSPAEAVEFFEDGDPPIAKGQQWTPRWDYYHRPVTVRDVDAGKVCFHYSHDPSLGFWLTEAEFLREYSYAPPEDA